MVGIHSELGTVFGGFGSRNRLPTLEGSPEYLLGSRIKGEAHSCLPQRRMPGGVPLIHTLMATHTLGSAGSRAGTWLHGGAHAPVTWLHMPCKPPGGRGT